MTSTRITSVIPASTAVCRSQLATSPPWWVLLSLSAVVSRSTSVEVNVGFRG